MRMTDHTNYQNYQNIYEQNDRTASSTADLMAIANTESQEILRGIYVRLSFKLWSVRAKGATGTDSKSIKSATRSIQKVMGKVKGKIKGLQKEDEMEMRASGTSATTSVDAGVSVDAAIAAAGVDAPMGVDTATAMAEVSGAVVDLAL